MHCPRHFFRRWQPNEPSNAGPYAGVRVPGWVGWHGGHIAWRRGCLAGLKSSSALERIGQAGRGGAGRFRSPRRPRFLSLCLTRVAAILSYGEND